MKLTVDQYNPPKKHINPAITNGVIYKIIGRADGNGVAGHDPGYFMLVPTRVTDQILHLTPRPYDAGVTFSYSTPEWACSFYYFEKYEGKLTLEN